MEAEKLTSKEIEKYMSQSDKFYFAEIFETVSLHGLMM